MQVLTFFLKRLCLETVIVQTYGELAIRDLTDRLAKVRQKPTRERNLLILRRATVPWNRRSDI